MTYVPDVGCVLYVLCCVNMLWIGSKHGGMDHTLCCEDGLVGQTETW